MPTFTNINDLPLKECTVTVNYTNEYNGNHYTTYFSGQAHCLLVCKYYVDAEDKKTVPPLIVVDKESLIEPATTVSRTSTSCENVKRYYSSWANFKTACGDAINNINVDDMKNFYNGSTIYYCSMRNSSQEPLDVQIEVTGDLPIFYDFGNTDLKITAKKQYPLTVPNGTTVNNYKGYCGASLPLVNILASIVGRTFPESYNISHTVYISSPNTKRSAFYIETTHDIENAYIESEIYQSIANTPTNAYSVNGEYVHWGRVANDRGAMKSYTYEDFYATAKDNVKVPKLVALPMQDIMFSFKDTIYYNDGTKQVEYSKVAFINSSDSVGLTIDRAMPSTETVGSHVKIVFVNGDPSDEQKATDSDGEAGDNSNYDGSDRYKKPDGDDTDNLKKGGGVRLFGDIIDCWYITRNNLKSLQRKLWSQSFFDILKINSDPMQNIISLKAFPFVNDVTDTGTIKIGDIDTGVIGNPITDAIKTYTTTPYKIGGKYNNFLDLQTNLGLYLPYIGFHKLDTSLFMYHWIKVEYRCDLLSGLCEVYIYRDNKLVDTIGGQMGCDVPLSASNQKQTEIAMLTKTINTAKSLGESVATKNIGGIVDTGLDFINNNPMVNYESSSVGSVLGASGIMSIFVLFDFPATAQENNVVYPNDYLKTYGAPCMRTFNINQMSGFFKCSGDIKLNGIDATQPEKDEIINLLKTGVYK